MYLSPREAAQLLGCSERAVRARLARGELRGFKQGQRWRIKRRDLRLPPERRAAVEGHDEAIRAAVERRLPSRRGQTPSHGSLGEIEVFVVGRDLLSEMAAAPAEVTAAIRDGLLAVGEAHHQFDRRVKLDAINRARASFGRAVACLLLTSREGDADTAEWVERLEGDVLRRLGGLARWVDDLAGAEAA